MRRLTSEFPSSASHLTGDAVLQGPHRVDVPRTGAGLVQAFRAVASAFLPQSTQVGVPLRGGPARVSVVSYPVKLKLHCTELLCCEGNLSTPLMALVPNLLGAPSDCDCL